MKILLIDNLDSFAFNLVEELKKKGCEVLVYRSSTDIKIVDAALKKFKPNLIIIGSGPTSLKDLGISKEVIRDYHEKIPIFGIGLGHQCILEVFGGRVGKAPEIANGISSKIIHDGKTIFKNVSNPFQAGRYHSLAGIDIPYEFEVTSRNEDDIVMGIRHKEHFVESIQFEPSSILTPSGSQIVDNLIKRIKK